MANKRAGCMQSTTQQRVVFSPAQWARGAIKPLVARTSRRSGIGPCVCVGGADWGAQG